MKQIAVLAIALLLVACQQNKQGASNDRPLKLPIVQAEKRMVKDFLRYPARVEGVVSSEIRAKVSGYITKVLVDEGSTVEKGQPLFQLETQSLSQDVEAARARVESAQLEVNRLKPLVEKDIVSPIQLKTAEAQLMQAKNDLESLRANVDYSTLRSPVNGQVGTIRFREGALVGPASAEPLTVVSQTDEVFVFFAMNERDYLDFLGEMEGGSPQEKLEQFPPVRFEMANGKRFPEEGRIGTVARQVDPRTGTVRFRAQFPNKNQLLSQGSSGVLEIPKVYENALIIPVISSLERQGNRYVFLVEDDTARMHQVEVRDEIGDFLVIDGGLEEGQSIVARGTGRLQGGESLKVRTVPMDSVANYETLFR